jgi:uncharacterized membrane protein YfcA
VREDEFVFYQIVVVILRRKRKSISYDGPDLIATHLAASLLALLIGVTLGALGGGGSIVTLPVLVYVDGVDPKQAVGMSLAIVGATSLFGAYLHSRYGNFSWRSALHFGSAGIAGSLTGSMLTHLIPSPVLVALFAILMLFAGGLMFTGRMVEFEGPPCSLRRLLVTGFGVGILSGFLGVGGGFLIVPALVWFTRLDTRRAVGTSLGIIACNSAAGLIGQRRFVHFSWPLTGRFVVVSLIGMAIGVALASRTPTRMLRRVFAVAVILIAAAMCINIVRS